MHKSVIEDFFDHILQRQTAHGPERAFRFKAIKASNGSVPLAHYPTNINNPAPSQHISKHSSQRNANAVPNAMPNAAPDARPVAAAEGHAVSAPKPSTRSKRVATGKKKPKQPGDGIQRGESIGGVEIGCSPFSYES
jgi:RNA recognition motif-containing protein